jgi:kynurenine formamidase
MGFSVRRAMAAVMTLGVAAMMSGVAAQAAAGDDLALWRVYDSTFASAKYIDLTHAFSPRQPMGVGFDRIKVEAARSAVSLPGIIAKGEPFSYEKQGVGITAYTLPTDQIGTQLDPPAHWTAAGATISELPATYAVRPLVVINIAPQVAKHAGYEATRADIDTWER